MNAPLGSFTTEQFLAEYWQKKPLLIRQALPDFGEAIEADELAGLACEDHIESRIIRGSGADNNWQQQHGPFEEQIFDELGDKDWTLLVQAVDHVRQRFTDRIGVSIWHDLKPEEAIEIQVEERAVHIEQQRIDLREVNGLVSEFVHGRV